MRLMFFKCHYHLQYWRFYTFTRCLIFIYNIFSLCVFLSSVLWGWVQVAVDVIDWHGDKIWMGIGSGWCLKMHIHDMVMTIWGRGGSGYGCHWSGGRVLSFWLWFFSAHSKNIYGVCVYSRNNPRNNQQQITWWWFWYRLEYWEILVFNIAYTCPNK